MDDSLNAEIEKLHISIAGLEAQREALGDEVVDPALESLREKLADLEAQQVGDSSPTRTEERRLITILFSDVVGSTALAEKLDPEEWRGVISRLHAACGEIIHIHTGQVAQYLGDGLLAFFGADLATENDPENAIRAALEIQAVVPESVNPLPGTENETIQLRVGIHSGLVVVGELGTEAFREFTATGDAMNLAARLQSSAPPGGVLISQDSYRYVRGVFDLTPQPPLQVKGKRDPLHTYLVRRARPRPFRVLARGVAGIETRTIGRQSEIDQIQGAYTQVYDDGKVAWVQLLGEPGIGKSRLVEDTREWLDLRPEQIWLLKARSYEGDRQQPFALIRRLWFDRFQIAEDAPLERAEARWVRSFQELMGSDELEPAHVMGALVGLPFEDSPYLKGMRGEATQIKGRAFVVSRELLANMRNQNPVELLLEDLHNADGASWEYLSEVLFAEGRSKKGVFVLATARKEWQPPDWLEKLAEQPKADSEVSLAAGFEGSPGNRGYDIYLPKFEHIYYLQIDLEPLSDHSTRLLAEDLLREVEGVPGAALDMIVERSEGNPFYAEELVTWFLDQGIIDRSREPWRFQVDRWRGTPLPSTLQHLLLTRLSQLSEAERFCLQCGAIFGRNFWAGGIYALGANPDLLTGLGKLGFLDRQPESTFEDDEPWSFRQSLLGEVVYESILKRQRARLHRLAGEWLEAQARAADRLEEFNGQLGEQAERAGELSLAVDWYLAAGECSQSQGGLREADRNFERAFRLLPPVEQERRWCALLGRASILADIGETEVHKTILTAILALAHEMGEDDRLAEANYLQGIYQDDYHEAVKALDAALDVAGRTGDLRIMALANSKKSVRLYRLGKPQAAESAADKALSFMGLLDDEITLADTLFNLGAYYGETKDYQRSLQMRQHEVEIWHRLGNRAREAGSLGNQGYRYLELGQYKMAREALESALEINQSIGARTHRAYNLSNLGLLHFRTGNLLVARQMLEEAILGMQAVGDTWGFATTNVYIGLVLEASGDMERAQRYYKEVLKLSSKLGGSGMQYNALQGLARCALASGRLEQAEQLAREVWEYITDSSPHGLEFPIWAFLTCADIFDALGETEKSRSAVEAGYNQLMTHAENLSDPEWRRAFIENIPEHRQIIAWWERLQG